MQKLNLWPVLSLPPLYTDRNVCLYNKDLCLYNNAIICACIVRTILFCGDPMAPSIDKVVKYLLLGKRGTGQGNKHLPLEKCTDFIYRTVNLKVQYFSTEELIGVTYFWKQWIVLGKDYSHLLHFKKFHCIFLSNYIQLQKLGLPFVHLHTHAHTHKIYTSVDYTRGCLKS